MSAEESTLRSDLPQQTTKKIFGKVVDTAGMPIIGANIYQKGTTNGTIADIDGNFVLEVPKGASIVVSYIGYNTRELIINTNSNYEVVLTEDTQNLEEVVVVGYGTQKKVNLTGSVAVVKSEQLQNRVATNVTNLLSGHMPGVTVIQSSGQPGYDTGTLRVRGIGTMNSGSDAMVIVDGVESFMNAVDPNDIDNISILKDASASAIYGVRAANGVILITTKKGAQGKAKVTYNGYIGWQEATRLPKFANSYDYAVMMNEAYRNDGATVPYSDEDLQKFKSGTDLLNYPNSDWLGELLSESGLYHNHHLSINGGNQGIRYAVSFGYHDKDGLIPNTNYKKINFRANLDAQINNRLSFNLNLAGYRSDAQEPAEGLSSIIHYAYRETPVTPIQAQDGHYVRFKNEHNSIQSAKEGGVYRTYSYNFTGNVGMEYKIIDGLKLRGSASTRFSLAENKTHYKTLSYYAPGSYDNLMTSSNYISNTDGKTLEVNLQAYLDYNKTFGKHAVSGLLGYSQIYNKYNNLYAYRRNLPASNSLDQINAGSETGQRTSGNETEYALRSGFARLNYAFNDRYLFEANVRYDGTSRFAKNNRFGAFPSFSLGWRISEEDFFKADWVNNLKLRASWGLLGNQEIGNYAFYNNYVFGYNYSFGGSKVQTISISSPMANEDITWEKTEQINVGVDATFFNNKLTATLDVFRKQTRDILLELPVMSMLGVSAPYQNAGGVRNTGFELQLGHNNRINDLQYSVTANVSYVKNKITDLKGADTPGQSVGDPLSAYFGYVCEGIFRTQDDIDNHADQSAAFGTPVLGDLMYKDVTGEGVVNSDDRVILGSAFPKWNFGLNLSASYKGFDLSALLQGAADVKAMVPSTVAYAFYNGGKVTEKYLDSWSPENPNGSMPRLSMSNSSNKITSSFWVTDASYVKMRNLQVGYSINPSILKKYAISRLRVYCSIDNLFTITGFEGTDPEATGNVHPLTRSYSFGLNLSF
ncbi:MAG: TonB-dependent receptor [Bacteroidaceae bacterium]|nr:TonB-dependent receptor [Bacteroidaceae bacterium]